MKIESDKASIRRAGIDDVEALVDYRVRFLSELGAGAGHHLEDDETQALRRNLQEYFSQAIPSGDFIALLAEYDGRIVGTGAMVVWRRPPRYGGLESGRAGYILNLYTVPEGRRKGICTQLLNALIKHAKSLGLKYLHLHASEDGIRIYRQAGFTEPDQVELELKLE